MDGNGRWATGRGLPRLAGHRQGASAARAVITAAPQCGVRTLTLYAFSSDNWRRPAAEVTGLMQLFRSYLRREAEECRSNGVRIEVIGRRDRLPGATLEAIETAERHTRGCGVLHLRIAVDYSSREMLLRAAQQSARLSEDAVSAALGPDVDLLVRTGGEQRLSDFLLWECAYAELIFLPCMWPDFTAVELRAAIASYHSRERRFGGLSMVAALPS